ncbi:MAG: sugar ABC transporter permease [Chloroflexota bacterium]
MAEKTKVESRLLNSQKQQSVEDYFNQWRERIMAGDLGILPTILGLVVITIIFQSQNSNFLSPINFVNLMVQMAGLTVLAYGAVFVLLIGEIDLSVGYVSAVAAGAMVILSVPEPAGLGLPWYIALAGGLTVGLLIGIAHGLIITTFQLPAFVVTLAGFLFWNGVLLIILGNGGTIRLQDDFLRSFTRTFLPDIWGYIVALLFIGGYTVVQFYNRNIRTKRGLGVTPLAVVGLQIGILSLLSFGAVFYANQNRGIPAIAVFVVFLLVVLTYVVDSTRYGRYLMAVGGNKEAARRAGIPVELIRTSVFAISGLMAAIGGMILSIRLGSVSTSFEAGNLLLNAIAAAVIGGTSLFGGRGTIYSALIGALIISAVDSGLGLLSLSSGVKFVVTGLVLLSAVVIDSFSRRRQQQSGIA